MRGIYNQLKGWYFDLSIAKKLNITNLVVVVLPILLLALLANKISYSAIVEKSIKNSVQNLELINQSLNGLMRHGEDLTKIIVGNDKVQTTLRKAVGRSNSITFEDDVLIKSLLDNIIESGSSISSVVLYTDKNHVLSSGRINTSKIKQGNWQEYERIKSTSIIDMHTIDYEFGSKTTYCVTFLKPVINTNDGSLMGKVEVNINEKNISNLYSHLKYGEKGRVLIVNNQGRIVSSADPSLLTENISKEPYFQWILKNNQKGTVFEIENEKYLITVNRFTPMDWTVLGLIPLNELTVDGNKVSNIILLTGLICIVLAILSSFIISKSISKPIVRLSKIMSSAGQGDLEVRASITSRDEIGLLSTSFNHMLERISSLMNLVYVEQRKKREFELLAIQAQINPHFLYNTLESICSLSQLGRNEDVFKMVKSLSMFYRIVLSKGRNIISIGEEFDNVRHYTDIQKLRYGEKFQCKIEVEEEILDKFIPKLSIQPLVENAIYHGIRNKKGVGLIKVIGKRQGEEAVISVTDNGLGFDEETLKNVLIASNENSKNASFGLKSVDDRIKLYFGSKYGIHIINHPLEGTTINVILPMGTERA